MTASQISFNYYNCLRLLHDPLKYDFNQFTGKLHFGRPFLHGRITVTENLHLTGWIEWIAYRNPGQRASDLSHLIDWSFLPQDLEIKGHFICSGFTNLISLPDTLIVQGNLILSNCTSFTTLPQELQLGGDLDLSGCTSLTALPYWIITLGPKSNGEIRHVNLADTGLLQSTKDWIKQVNPVGMKFHF